MAKQGKGKHGGGQVIAGSDGDILLVNGSGDVDGDAPSGILIPAASAVGLTLTGEGAWQTALGLLKKKKATEFPVRSMSTISQSLTAITLLMDREKAPGSSTAQSQGKKAGKKAPAPKKKPASKKR